jgi:hypothetical protein
MLRVKMRTLLDEPDSLLDTKILDLFLICDLKNLRFLSTYASLAINQQFHLIGYTFRFDYCSRTTNPLTSFLARPNAFNPTITDLGSKNRKSSTVPSITL